MLPPHYTLFTPLLSHFLLPPPCPYLLSLSMLCSCFICQRLSQDRSGNISHVEMGGSTSKTVPTFNVYENAAPGTGGTITASTNDWHASTSTWATLAIAGLLAVAAILGGLYCIKRAWRGRQRRRAERSALVNALAENNLAAPAPRPVAPLPPSRPTEQTSIQLPYIHPSPWQFPRQSPATYYNEVFQMDLQPLPDRPPSASITEIPQTRAPPPLPPTALPAITAPALPASDLPRNSIWRQQ